MTTLYLHSAFGDPPAPVHEAATSGRVIILPQHELTTQCLAACRGLVTTTQLDQDMLLLLTPALEAFLDRGVDDGSSTAMWCAR